MAPAQGSRGAQALVELAELQRERGAFAEAEATLRQALSADGRSAEVWHSLGLLRSAQGEIGGQGACLHRRLPVTPLADGERGMLRSGLRLRRYELQAALRVRVDDRLGVGITLLRELRGFRGNRAKLLAHLLR